MIKVVCKTTHFSLGSVPKLTQETIPELMQIIRYFELAVALLAHCLRVGTTIFFMRGGFVHKLKEMLCETFPIL